MEAEGKIVFYDIEKKFGFVKTTQWPIEDFFFHINSCPDLDFIEIGRAVKFVLVESRTKPGRFTAIHLKYV